jgi:hypothetical protein
VLSHDFFKTGPLVLGLTEVDSLHLAEHPLSPLAGTLFAEGLRSALDKVGSLLPTQALDYFPELDSIVYVACVELFALQSGQWPAERRERS